MADLTGMLQAAAGAGGEEVNPNAWDISKAFYDAGSQVWNVSTLTYAGYVLQGLGSRGIFFQSDGTKLFLVYVPGPEVRQYNMTVPWNITNTSLANTLDISSQAGAAYGLFFKPDGTRFFVVDQTTDTIYQYSLTSAWDLSTASYDSVSFSVATQETTPTGLFFKPDGTKMYICGTAGSDVNEYDLSTAWDVSSASYVQNFSVSSQETTPTDLWFRSDGEKMYVIGSGADKLNEYDLSTPWDVSSASFLQSVLTTSQSPTGLYIKDNGGQVYFGSLQNAGVTSTRLFANLLGSYIVSAQDLNPEDLFFKPDGTKMYVVGLSGQDINEYSLSTAWDISSASYVQNFSVSSQETGPRGLFFKSDGTKMYIVGSTGDAVYEYTLSTAWDISSASYVQNFSVSAQETTPEALFFKDDGTKMYVLGSTGDDVNEYDLSTPWDISSASYLQNFSVSAYATAPHGLSFKSDGTKMYVLNLAGNPLQALVEYNLSTPWDISTATYLQLIYLSETIGSTGLYWRPNGGQFFTVSATLDGVSAYSISPE